MSQQVIYKWNEASKMYEYVNTVTGVGSTSGQVDPAIADKRS